MVVSSVDGGEGGWSELSIGGRSDQPLEFRNRFRSSTSKSKIEQNTSCEGWEKIAKKANTPLSEL